MGMFDYVSFKDNCKRCGAELKDFQTKDTECLLETVHPSETRRFYTSCDKCDLWHEFKIVVKDYQVVCTTRDFDQERKEEEEIKNNGTAD